MRRALWLVAHAAAFLALPAPRQATPQAAPPRVPIAVADDCGGAAEERRRAQAVGLVGSARRENAAEALAAGTPALATLSLALLALSGSVRAGAKREGAKREGVAPEDGAALGLSPFGARLLEREFRRQCTDFAPSNELPALRRNMAAAKQALDQQVAEENYDAAARWRDELLAFRSRDPSEAVRVLSRELDAFVTEERFADAAQCRDDLLTLRMLLPQFNLSGLWKGFDNHHQGKQELLVELRYKKEEVFAIKAEGGDWIQPGDPVFCADVSTDAHIDLGEDFGRLSEHFLGAFESTSGDEVDSFPGSGFTPGRLFVLDEDMIAFLWQSNGLVAFFARC